MLWENGLLRLLKRFIPTINFLFIHCIKPSSWQEFPLANFYFCIDVYIISSCLVGSLLIYCGKNISYINALFFAAGSATQAGLNPVDVNLLNTWQQVVWFFYLTNFTLVLDILDCDTMQRCCHQYGCGSRSILLVP